MRPATTSQITAARLIEEMRRPLRRVQGLRRHAASGVDTGDYSFPYVARWAQDMKVFRRNLAEVQQISHRLIEVIGDDCIPSDEQEPQR